jgi:uncharacterized protein (DUF433 family)
LRGTAKGQKAEFEGNVIRKCTLAGLKAARARGGVGGRPEKLSVRDKQQIRAAAQRPRSPNAHQNRPLRSAPRKDKLRRMAATSYRYLVNLPGVCQGKTIVEGTRIGVHDVVGLIINGASVEDVCRSFPDLSRAQVYECLAYYEDHRTEIDALVAEQMREQIT